MPIWKPSPSKLSGDPNDIEHATISMQLTSRDAIDVMRRIEKRFQTELAGISVMLSRSTAVSYGREVRMVDDLLVLGGELCWCWGGALF